MQSKRKPDAGNALDEAWDLILLNILYVFFCLPVLSYGAATAALYRTVADRKEKRACGGIVPLFWQKLKNNWKKPTALWMLVLVCAGVVFADFLIVSKLESIIKYCYFGLLAFVAFLLQVLLSAGLPLSGAKELPVRQLICQSFFLFAAHPLTVTVVCILQLLPLAAALLAGRLFAALFLVWTTGYFSLSSRISTALLEPFLPSL